VKSNIGKSKGIPHPGWFCIALKEKEIAEEGFAGARKERG
jgi:hypothetical protein